MQAVDPATPRSPLESQKPASKAFGLPFLDAGRVGLTIRRRRRRASECPAAVDGNGGRERLVVKNPQRSVSLRLSKNSRPASVPTSPTSRASTAPASRTSRTSTDTERGEVPSLESLGLGKARKAFQSFVGMASHARKGFSWLARATGNEDAHLSVDVSRLAESVRIRRGSAPNHDCHSASSSSHSLPPEMPASPRSSILSRPSTTSLQDDHLPSWKMKKSTLSTVVSEDDGCPIVGRQSESDLQRTLVARVSLRKSQHDGHAVSFDSIGIYDYDAKLGTPLNMQPCQASESNAMLQTLSASGSPDCETASVASSSVGDGKLKTSPMHKRGITVLVKKARVREKSRTRERSQSQSPPSERFLQMCKEFDNLLAPVRGSIGADQLSLQDMPRSRRESASADVSRSSSKREKPVKPKRSACTPEPTRHSLTLNDDSAVFSDGSNSMHSICGELGTDRAGEKPAKPQRLFSSWKKRSSSKKRPRSAGSMSEQASCHSLVSGYSLGSSQIDVPVNSQVQNEDDRTVENQQVAIACADGQQGITQEEVDTGKVPTVESLSSNAATETRPVESLTSNAATETRPVESLTSNAATETRPIESLTSNAATETRPVEFLTSNAATETRPVESLTSNPATETPPVVVNLHSDLKQTAIIVTGASPAVTKRVTAGKEAEPLVVVESVLEPAAVDVMTDSSALESNADLAQESPASLPKGENTPELIAAEESPASLPKGEKTLEQTAEAATPLPSEDPSTSRTNSLRRPLTGSRKFQRKASMRISRYVEKFEGITSASSSPAGENAPLMQAAEDCAAASVSRQCSASCISTYSNEPLSRQDSVDSLDMSTVKWREEGEVRGRKAPQRSIAIRQNAESFDHAEKTLGIVGHEELMRRWSVRRNKLHHNKMTAKIIESYEKRDTGGLVRQVSMRANIGPASTSDNAETSDIKFGSHGSCDGYLNA